MFCTHLVTTPPVLLAHAPLPRAPVYMASPPGPPSRRRLLWAVLLLSFVPYLAPPELQPALYKDGKTPEELQRRRKRRMTNAYLGGDIARLEELLPDH